MQFYRISGLTVAADMALPGAVPLADPPETTDVRVTRGTTPARLDDVIASGPAWQLTPRQFLLDLPGIGRFLASDGAVLTMDSAPGADPDDGLPFLLGTGFGALLYQRGAMLLHASAVAEDGGGAIALCGRSGLGKSTLAAALCRAGCRFVCDDIGAIGLDAGQRPVLWPDGRSLKLCGNIIEQLDLGSGRQGEVRAGIGKHYVAPPQGGDGQPTPLRAIYVLRDQRPSMKSGIEPLSALETAQALLNQSYRRRLALALAGNGRQMAITAAIIHHVPVFSLTRPRDLARLNDGVAEILAHWRGLGG